MRSAFFAAPVGAGVGGGNGDAGGPPASHPPQRYFFLPCITIR